MFSRNAVGAIDDATPPTGGEGSTTGYSTKGIYGLKKCHDSEEAVADIVFVHGLTGNRETTWTSKNGVFWPAHLLKNDVPRTRILTFGYDADVVHFWAMASQNRIRNHATNLVNALVQLRERTDTEWRPILFVTHSLGGLVFEDAMIASRNSAEPHIQRIYDATYGVCFLATPHCGSTLANWASVLGQITSVVKKTDTSLLRALQPESEVLALIQTDFHNMVRGRQDQGRPALRITCFYEELPVRGIGEIVPKHSAILPAYNAIGIHNNHMDMPKFSSDEDPGYLSVSTEILRWVRELQRGTAAQQSNVGTQNPVPGPAFYGDMSGWAGQVPFNPVPPPGRSSGYQGHVPAGPGGQGAAGMGWQGYGVQAIQMPSSSSPSLSHQHLIGSVTTGTINNYGGGKVVQGNNFQGPVNF